MKFRHVLRMALGTMPAEFAFAAMGLAATSNPYTFTTSAPPPPQGHVILVGATMGQNWNEFPSALAADYQPTGPWDQVLDVNLQLFVTWILDTAVSPSPVQVNPPVALSSFAWFNPAIFSVFDIQQEPFDFDYVSCAQNHGIELPVLGDPTPLDANGLLHVRDVHGGVGDQTLIHLRALPEGGFSDYNIFVSWDHPATHFDDYLGADVNRAPESVYNRRITVRNPVSSQVYSSFTHVRIVEWVSTDAGGTETTHGPSPRFVDAGDLAYFVTFMGQAVRWGFESGESPPLSPNFQCDFAPDGFSINASDLALLASDLGKSCQLTKTGASEDVATILDWFGIAATGRTIAVAPTGELLPEYAVVDWEKTRRAIADPYGYRNITAAAAAKTLSWSLVKVLYR